MADFGQTDFGQTDFGQPFWRPSLAKPTLASVSVLVVWPTLAKTDFGQLWPNRLWLVVLCVVCSVWCVFVCLCVAWVLVSRFHGVGFHVWVLVSKFWFGRCSVPPRTALFTQQPENSNTCTFEGPGASNTTKIPREDPEGRKERILRRERGKRARNFGPPPFGPHPSGPTLRAPPFGPHPWGHHPSPPFRPTPLERSPHTWSTTGPPTTTQHTQKTLNN